MNTAPHKISGETPPSCWVAGEGLAGTENQCIGIARALGLSPSVKRVGLRWPWSVLSPWLGLEGPHAFTGDALGAPWPDIAIGSGRKSIAVMRHIRRENPAAFLVQVQDPKIMDPAFDMVVVPDHDRPNSRDSRVVTTIGAPNGIDDQLLAAARSQWESAFAHLPRPLTAVLIGGPNKIYKMSEQDVVKPLEKLVIHNAGGFLVTVSRRTSPAIRAGIASLFPKDRAFVWDGAGANPYHGFLAHADYIVVTGDSVSMASEAASTGKPVHLLRLPGRPSKFDRFHQSLIDYGAARWFDGSLSNWNYTPLREAERIAALIREQWNKRT